MPRAGHCFVVAGLAGLIAVPARGQEPVERLRVDNQTAIWNVDVSADGRTLVVAGTQPANVRELGAGAVTATFKGGYTPDCVAISRDGARAATGTGGDNLIRIWDAASGAELRVLRGHRAQVRSLDFSRDGRFLVSGDASGVVKTWGVAGGAELKTFMGHEKKVNRVAFAPSGRYVASASEDGTVRVWNLSLGTLSVVLSTETENLFVAFSPDSTLLVVDDAEGVAAIWNDDGKKIRTLGGSDDKAGYAAAFLPDGASVVTGDEDGRLRVWDVATGRPKASVKAHEETVNDVRTSSSGAIVTSARLEFAVWSLPGAATAAAKPPGVAALAPLAGARAADFSDTVPLRRVLREFQRAAEAGEIGALKKLAVGGGKSDAEVRAWTARQLEGAPKGLLMPGKAMVAGDAADVEVSGLVDGQRKQGTARLRRQGGEWKVETFWAPRE
jgi:hypothetical protein